MPSPDLFVSFSLPVTSPTANVDWPVKDNTHTRGVTIDCAAWLASVDASSLASVTVNGVPLVTVSNLAVTNSTKIIFQVSGGSANTTNRVTLNAVTNTSRTEVIVIEIPLAADDSGTGVTRAYTAHTISAAPAAPTATEYEYDVSAHGVVGESTSGAVGAANSAALVTLIAAITTALGSRNARANLVFPGTTYPIGNAVQLPSNIRIVGKGKPRLLATGSNGTIFTASSASNFAVSRVIFDSNGQVSGDPISLNGCSAFELEEVELIGASGAISLTSCSDGMVDQPRVSNGRTHGVYMNGCSDCTVKDGVFQNNTFFGVILTNGCFRNLIEGNKTTANGIELVGVTQDSFENRIINNHAEGTGDNGISITGFKNVVMGNICKGCQGNGITLYGERNLVVGNTCQNNAKGNAGNSGWRAGIALQGGFGGVAQYNTVVGNILDDSQAAPTQTYGIWIGATTAYTAWASGQSIAGTANSPVYRYNGAVLYKASASGTTGATAPTHTTGSVSDGGVTWTFVRVMLTGDTTAGWNEIANNNIVRYGTAKYLDASGATTNEFSGGFVPVTLPSTLIASSISNTGGLAGINISGTYQLANGANATVSITAPQVSGGQQAAAVVGSYFLLGFGSIGAAGTGYAVNDVLSFVGGTPLNNGTPLQIKVTSIGANGAITGFTNNGTGTFTYTALPPSGNTALSGGTGTGATLTGTSWHVNSFTITAAGSGYTAAPTVTISPVTGTPVITASTTASMTLNAGTGKVVMDTTGTKLGVAGATGSAVLTQGATVDSSGQRVTLTTSGYTVLANSSLVRFVQTGTVATATVTLPTAMGDGHAIQFVNYAGAVTALTFSPAVTGFTNASAFAANTGMRIRWDATDSTWHREQ